MYVMKFYLVLCPCLYLQVTLCEISLYCCGPCPYFSIDRIRSHCSKHTCILEYSMPMPPSLCMFICIDTLSFVLHPLLPLTAVSSPRLLSTPPPSHTISVCVCMSLGPIFPLPAHGSISHPIQRTPWIWRPCYAPTLCTLALLVCYVEKFTVTAYRKTLGEKYG
jgi:hypothetical protein